MIQGMNAALSGLRAYINQTRVTANNLANLNTPGFKGSSAVQSSAPGGFGVTMAGVQSSQSQGAIINTGQPFDMAIGGAGFFKVITSGGATAYTRAGGFVPDKNGRLADASGNTLQPPIQVPANATSVSIGRDGSVTALVNGQSQNIGQVGIYKFNNPGGLQNGGSNTYLETQESGQPIQGTPGSGGFGEIYPSSLEQSNVDIGRQMVNLIQAQHGFSAQIKTIQTADEMLGSLLDIKS
jgi:flagellar basal-body rod protein FlgG